MMKTISKKLISLALVLALLVSAVPFAVSAAEAKDVAEVAAKAVDVADTSAAAEDVAEVAAKSFDIADTGAQADLADTGVNYQVISGYEAPFGISVTTSVSFPWTIVDADNGIMASSNQNVHNSMSYVKIVASFEGTLSFDYFSSGETNYDYLCYKVCAASAADSVDPNASHDFWTKGVNNTSVTTLAGITTWGQAEESLNAGDALVLAFRKDGSGNSGADTAWIKNIRFDTDVDPDNLPDTQISFSLVSPEGIDFSVSDTQGGEPQDSFTGTYGDFGTFYISHPMEYSIVKIYSDSACNQLVATGDSLSLPFSDSDTVYYVKLEKEWDSISGYSAPADVQVMVKVGATYPWTTRVVDGVTQLISGNYNINSSESFMRIYCEKAGILSFNWHCTSEGTSDGLVYKFKDAAVSKSNYTARISGNTDVWQTISFEVAAGDSVYFDYYKDSSVHRNDDLGIVKDINLNTSISSATATFVCEDDHGFVSSNSSTDPSYKVESVTGTSGTTLGTLYVIPDCENGWKLEGVYTTPDYQAGTKINPRSNTAYRTFDMIYPDEDTTYYVHFVQQTAVRYYFDFDESIFGDSISVYRVSAFNHVDSLDGEPYQTLADGNAVAEFIGNGGYVEFYPGDRVAIEMGSFDSSSYKYTGLTHGEDAYSSGNAFYVETPENGWHLTLNSLNIGYTEIPGFTGDNVKIYHRPEYNVTGSYNNYQWEYEDGIFTPTNVGINYSFSYMKMVAQHDGLLVFDYKTSSESGYDALYYKKGTDDPTTSSGYTNSGYDLKYDFSGEHDWTPLIFEMSEGEELHLTYYKDSMSEDGEDCVWIRNVKLLYGDKTITVASNNDTLGTVEIEGTDEMSITDEVLTEVTVKATEAAGQFVSWKDSSGIVLSTDLEYTFSIMDNADLTATFAPALAEGQDPVAVIESAQFATLEAALSFSGAGDIVVLVDNYTLTENVTIPAGVTLLVPYDDAHTMTSGHAPLYRVATQANPVTVSSNAYVTLTVAENVTITCLGTMCVNSLVPATTPNATAYSLGPVADKYGHVILSAETSVINVNSGVIECYGFITGPGKVNVNGSSTVYEYFVIQDWPGGTASSNMSGTGEFPFNQYYVQNIECSMTMQSTAREITFITIHIPSWGSTETVLQEFIGPEGMFRPANGTTVTKYYDPVKDKCIYTINGDSTIGAIEVYGFSSSSYYLPMNNMDVVLESGTMTFDKKTIFLQGSTITVNEDAELHVANNGQIIFADKEFTGYSFPGNRATNSHIPIRFSPSREPQAKTYVDVTIGGVKYTTNFNNEWSALEPAYIDNNGSVVVDQGCVMCSTNGGDSLKSSEGTGTYEISSNAQPPVLSIHQTSNGSPATFNTDVAELDNGGDSPVENIAVNLRWSSNIPAVYTKVTRIDPATNESISYWTDVRTIYYYAHETDNTDPDNCSSYVATGDSVEITSADETGDQIRTGNPSFDWSFATKDENGYDNYLYTFDHWDYSLHTGGIPGSGKLQIAMTGASTDIAASGAAPALAAHAVYTRTMAPHTYTWHGLDADMNAVSDSTVELYDSYPLVTPDDLTNIVSEYVNSEDGKTYHFAGWRNDTTGVVYAAGNVIAVVDGTNTSYTAVYKASFENITLTLDDGIKVNYIVNVPAGYTADQVRVDFTWGKKYLDTLNDGRDYIYSDSETNTASADLIDKFGRKVAIVNIAPKEINDTITAKLVVKATGAVIDSDSTFSAATYLYNAIGYDTEAIARNTFNVAPVDAVTPAQTTAAAALQELCKTTLAYGASAQCVFQYNTGALADSALDAADRHDSSDVEAAKAEIISDFEYEYCDPDNEYSLESEIWVTDFTSVGFNATCGSGGYYGSAMTLDYEATYNLYFRYSSYVKYNVNIVSVDDNRDPIAGHYSSNSIGIKVLEDNDGDFVRLDIRNIPAGCIRDIFKVTLTPVSGGSAVEFYVSPITYFCNVLNSRDDVASAELKNVVANVYLYSAAAAVYFEARDNA